MELLNKILYALPVYQSAALALLLLINGFGNRSRARILMGIFQLLCTLYFTFNFSYAIRNFEVLLVLYFLILPVILLFLPLFYLYLLSITTPGFRFHRSNFRHLIPSAVFLMANVPFLFTGTAEKLDYLMHGFNSSVHSGLVLYLTLVYITGIFLVLPLQLAFYFLTALKLYRKHRSYIQDHYSYTENISLNWILALMASLVIFFLSNQMLYISEYDKNYFSPLIYNVLMLVITLLTGYYALSQKDLKALENKDEDATAFQDSPGLITEVRPEGFVPEKSSATSGVIEPEENHETASLPEAGQPEDAQVLSKYAGSPLSEQRKMAITDRLEILMKHEKIFRNDKLSVEDVANRLETNTKYVSQVINERYGKNFYNYINTYRVEEAQKLLLSGGWEKYSMLGIALMVGFGSKSSFNSSFKRITGLTPSEYVRHNS